MYGAGYPAAPAYGAPGYAAAPAYGAPAYAAAPAYGAPGYVAPVAPGMMPAGCMAYQPGMMIPAGYKLSKKGYLKPISKNPYKASKKMYKHHWASFHLQGWNCFHCCYTK